MYNHQGSSPGDHTAVSRYWAHHNVIVHLVTNGAWCSVAGNSIPTGDVRIHNNSVWYADSLSEFVACTMNGMTVDLANNAVRLPAGFVFGGAVYGGTVTSRNNIISGAAQGAWQSGGYGPMTESGLSMADPQFVAPGVGNLNLGPASPAIGSGVVLGYTQDYARNPIIGTPDRGELERL